MVWLAIRVPSIGRRGYYFHTLHVGSSIYLLTPVALNARVSVVYWYVCPFGIDTATEAFSRSSVFTHRGGSHADAVIVAVFRLYPIPEDKLPAAGAAIRVPSIGRRGYYFHTLHVGSSIYLLTPVALNARVSVVYWYVCPFGIDTATEAFSRSSVFTHRGGSHADAVIVAVFRLYPIPEDKLPAAGAAVVLSTAPGAIVSISDVQTQQRCLLNLNFGIQVQRDIDAVAGAIGILVHGFRTDIDAGDLGGVVIFDGDHALVPNTIIHKTDGECLVVLWYCVFLCYDRNPQCPVSTSRLKLDSVILFEVIWIGSVVAVMCEEDREFDSVARPSNAHLAGVALQNRIRTDHIQRVVLGVRRL